MHAIDVDPKWVFDLYYSDNWEIQSELFAWFWFGLLLFWFIILYWSNLVNSLLDYDMDWFIIFGVVEFCCFALLNYLARGSKKKQYGGKNKKQIQLDFPDKGNKKKEYGKSKKEKTKKSCGKSQGPSCSAAEPAKLVKRS